MEISCCCTKLGKLVTKALTIFQAAEKMKRSGSGYIYAATAKKIRFAAGPTPAVLAPQRSHPTASVSNLIGTYNESATMSRKKTSPIIGGREDTSPLKK